MFEVKVWLKEDCKLKGSPFFDIIAVAVKYLPCVPSRNKI
jgi:hypothetical protein